LQDTYIVVGFFVYKGFQFMQDALRNFKSDFFKALSHPARIKILELLRPGELSVTELQDGLGIEASSVSQHLSVLRHKNIVETRKVSTTVYYRVSDTEIFELLDVARRIFNNQLINTRSTLEQLEEENIENIQTHIFKSTSPISK
jgi:DNA-binding transcriptional ArsR family regulator